MPSRLKFGLLVFVVMQAALSLADSFNGTVHNQTTGKPAVNDEVILLRLGEGMQEQSRIRTDAQGAFSVPVPVSTAQYVVRVMHGGVNYDQSATANAPLDISVYDSVTHIAGLRGTMGMAQIESDGTFLKITEMYAIRNASNPPVTQANPRNYTFTLPAKATLESAQVRSGEHSWIKAPMATSKANEYAINFPLRPGDTLIKFIYHLPYDGETRLHLKLAYPIEKFAVIHPPSMKFRALNAKAFVAPGLANGMALEKAVSEPLSGEVPAFVISGTGIAPPRVAAKSPALAAPPAAQPAPAPQAANTAKPDPASRLSKAEVWLLLGGIALVLGGGLVVLRTLRLRRQQLPPAAKPSGQSLLDALKEELFQLESERLHGSISAEEYASTKQALNVGIQRALSKNKI